jgi:hypothetical protein
MSSSETDPDPLWRAFAQMRVEEGNLNDHLDLPHLLQLIPPGEGALDLRARASINQTGRGVLLHRCSGRFQ